MIQNFWIKDHTRSEVITKTQIPNKNNFEIFACYFNFMDEKGLSVHFTKKTKIATDKLFTKNNFQYFIFEHDNVKELLILPNENLVEYTEKVISKIDICKSNEEVLQLMINEMN
ncbi:MAG: hypothetical protein RLZZ175_1709 [Bacteroidota bacterium]|jgi:hypothetical protein